MTEPVCRDGRRLLTLRRNDTAGFHDRCLRPRQDVARDSGWPPLRRKRESLESRFLRAFFSISVLPEALCDFSNGYFF